MKSLQKQGFECGFFSFNKEIGFGLDPGSQILGGSIFCFCSLAGSLQQLGLDRFWLVLGYVPIILQLEEEDPLERQQKRKKTWTTQRRGAVVELPQKEHSQTTQMKVKLIHEIGKEMES